MNGPAARPDRRLWLVALAAAAWILVLAARTPVPSEDGVSYLWLAQQFAAGGWREALASVFPPGFPLLCAPGIACGLDPERVALGVGLGCVVAALWPVWRVAEHFAVRAGLQAAILWACTPLLPRLAAETYSEPPFLLCMAWGTWCGVRGRWWWLGMCAGVAFWIRPEGLLLVGAFGLAAPRQAWRAALPAFACVLALAVLRAVAGHGFDPLPLHGFHEQRFDLPERGDLLANLLQVPGGWLEAFGVAALLPLGLLWRRPEGPAGRCALVWGVLLQIAVVCTFVVRRRFFVSAAVPALVLGALALAAWPRRIRVTALLLATALGLGSAFFGTIEPDRLAERELGAWLRTQLLPGRTATGDLPRVLWFAGQPPPPPRHFTADELRAFAAPPAVQFVVLSARSQRSSSRQAPSQLPPDFTPFLLPEPVASSCRQRGLLVLSRQ